MPEQMGLEPSPFDYVANMAAVFDEVRRVLKPTGSCWVVIGDSYAGSGKGRMEGGAHYTIDNNGPSTKQATNKGAVNGIIPATWHGGGNIKPKDLCGIPWRLAFALQDRGWYLRQDIIWAKPNPMPESVKDRCTRSHEYIFMLSKNAKYYYNAESIAEQLSGMGDRLRVAADIQHGGILPAHTRAIYSGRAGDPVDGLRNRRDVWQIQTEPWAESHFATFPTKLVELCILAGSPAGGMILDPFSGAGTTLEVALKLGRRALGVELNPEYCAMIQQNLGLFAVAG
jgi:DNA modification methylase